ncbi:LDB17 [[Candida] subhashii]|uniref:LDB17 n=1 Tax=[Candida] subhashii TaxID=561895 RepID=A0A8J5QML1_9ASCO|nr:LDB17 [[Candida] subhashii]KAG7663195.1 LDB17 [[Candida] subhashii]
MYSSSSSSTFGNGSFNNDGFPIHSFPSGANNSPPQPPGIMTPSQFVQQEIDMILINSDSSACNENFSIFIKYIIDNVYTPNGDGTGSEMPTYQSLSLYALKLLTSNLFLKNYKFCLGKILAFLKTFTRLTEARLTEDQDDKDNDEEKVVIYEAECVKEFLCIVLLLLLKVKNTGPSDSPNCATEPLEIIEDEDLYSTLRSFNFISVISQFITTQVKAISISKSSYVILKFGCDIFFEYLFHVGLLQDDEFESLTNNTELISTLIKYLLTNENFNNYDLDSDDFEDEDKLIAYEEFKLLLLINEQYLMKFYTSGKIKNKVFDGLMKGNTDDNSIPNLTNITGFINLMIYHLNREESHIIKILILKFLYLVFTTSYTTRLVYLNDLKILVDIFIRELNNMDFTGDKIYENRNLTLTYLRVLYPILLFSQFKDINEGYRTKELMDLFSNIIINSDILLSDLSTDSINNNESEKENAISKLAQQCMSIKWLKHLSKKDHSQSQPKRRGSSESSSETSSVKDEIIEPSQFTRVLSVRASTRNDYHNNTRSHNIVQQPQEPQKSIYAENNNNIFLTNTTKSSNTHSSTTTFIKSPWTGEDIKLPPTETNLQSTSHNILDLPKEYLKSKPLPVLPIPEMTQSEPDLYLHKTSSSTSSVNSASSSLVLKALKKKAPPPPPPRSRLNSPAPELVKGGGGGTGPPPPPPSRRRR